MIWGSSGSHLGTTWGTFGDYLGNTWGSAEIKAENNTKKARRIINGFLFIELRVLIIAQLFFTVTIRYLQ